MTHRFSSSRRQVLASSLATGLAAAGLATPALADRSVDAYAVRELRAQERPSDHTAVVGVFRR